MPLSARLSLLLALGACQGIPEEPEIVGGTPEQRALALEAYRAFMDELRPEAIPYIPQILFDATLPSTRLGQWPSRSRVVSLAVDLKPEQLPTVLRHEICHAIDHDLDIANRLGPFLPPVPGLSEEDDGQRHREVIASFCQFGAADIALWATASTCAPIPIARPAFILLHEAYLPDDDRPVLQLPGLRPIENVGGIELTDSWYDTDSVRLRVPAQDDLQLHVRDGTLTPPQGDAMVFDDVTERVERTVNWQGLALQVPDGPGVVRWQVAASLPTVVELRAAPGEPATHTCFPRGAQVTAGHHAVAIDASDGVLTYASSATP